MERLVTKEGQLYACGYGHCNDEVGCICGDCHYTEKALNRLAAYEETGLMPDEILTGKGLAEAACALIERIAERNEEAERLQKEVTRLGNVVKAYEILINNWGKEVEP